jgi:cystathionine beta-lyase/cystathionine gamma-synthase
MPVDDVTRFPLKPRTLADQALGASEPVTNALVPPVHLATTYLRDADNGYRSGYVYGRTDNATVRQAEALIAALEHGDEAMLFASRHGGCDRCVHGTGAAQTYHCVEGHVLGSADLAEIHRAIRTRGDVRRYV